MARQSPYYRAPVLIFALLVGGLYVYAKGGGSLLSRRPQVTPAANQPGDEPGAPSVEFMLGSKSARAFNTRDTIQPPSPRTTSNETRPILLPGSKSMVLELPTSPAVAPQPAQALPPVQPAPNAAPERRAMFSGSKSAAVISSESLNSPPPAIQQQAAPQRARPAQGGQP